MLLAGFRRLGRFYVLALSLLIAALALPFVLDLQAGGGGVVHAADPVECPVPVDISIVFDHSGSMGSPASKLTNAKAAAIGFINGFSGGPSDDDLSPHTMALTGFSNGDAIVEDVLGTDAVPIRADVNGFSASGFTNISRALQLGQLQLEQPTDPDTDTLLNPDTNDYITLLSDGSANRPEDVDDTGAENDLYIDVNDNGVLDSNDDLSVDFPAPEDDAGAGDPDDFIVVNGLWQVPRTIGAPVNQLNVDGDGGLDNDDDYDFIADYLVQHPTVTPNIQIIDGTLYVDANGDGSFTVNAANGPNPGGAPVFVLGHDDELEVLRDGMVADATNFSGDGSDVDAYYWATQSKSAGTTIFVLGYDLGGDQDAALMQLLATSPAHYFGGGQTNVSSIFTSIAQAICGFSLQKTLTSDAQAYVGESVTYTITLTNTGTVDLQNVDLHDDYDQTKLDFVSASVGPTTTSEGTGDLDWTNLSHGSPDLDPQVWEPGTTLTIDLKFIALAKAASTDNCVQITDSDTVPPGSTHPVAGPACAPVEILTPVTPISTSTPTNTPTATAIATSTATATPCPPGKVTTGDIYYPCGTPTPMSTPTRTNTPPALATPTRTNTPPVGAVTGTPGSLGGISFDPGGGGQGSSGTGGWYVAAATAAAGVLALGGAAWYARRRLLR